MSFVYTNLDSQICGDGSLVDILDPQWAAEKLPFEDIHVPVQELPDPEPDNSSANLTLRQLEFRWTDLMLHCHQKTPPQVPQDQPISNPSLPFTPMSNAMRTRPR